MEDLTKDGSFSSSPSTSTSSTSSSLASAELISIQPEHLNNQDWTAPSTATVCPPSFNSPMVRAAAFPNSSVIGPAAGTGVSFITRMALKMVGVVTRRFERKDSEISEVTIEAVVPKIGIRGGQRGDRGDQSASQ